MSFLSILPLVLALQTGVPAEAPAAFTERVPPLRIADNLYYVGTRELASYLLVSDAGHILIDGGIEPSAAAIVASIGELGFRTEDVRIILSSHPHIDHAMGLRSLRERSGAAIMALGDDARLLETGGRADPVYGNQYLFPAVKVDRRLRDRETIRLGNLAVTVHQTPGHTEGNATWVFSVPLEGRPRQVVIAGSMGIAPTARLAGPPSYTAIVADFEAAFARLKTLGAEIFLSTHGSYFGLDDKRRRSTEGDVDAFVDPKGYLDYVRRYEAAFIERLQREMSAAGTDVARIVVLEPAQNGWPPFEAGYKRHLEWHRKVGDPWTWYGWQIVSGPRIGLFMDGTFGHTWPGLDRTVLPAEDAADNALNVAPYAEFRANGYWRRRPDLSDDDALERGEPSPWLQLLRVDVVPGAQDRFEAAVRALGVKHTAYELALGGRAPGYLVMIPFSSFADQATASAAIASFVRSLGSSAEGVEIELLRYRPDLSYVPGPQSPEPVRRERFERWY